MNLSAIEYALGKIGTGASAAEQTLEGKLASKDDNVRIMGAWALAQIDAASPNIAAKDVPVLVAGLVARRSAGKNDGRGGARLLWTIGKGRRRGPAKGFARCG